MQALIQDGTQLVVAFGGHLSERDGCALVELNGEQVQRLRDGGFRSATLHEDGSISFNPPLLADALRDALTGKGTSIASLKAALIDALDKAQG